MIANDNEVQLHHEKQFCLEFYDAQVNGRQDSQLDAPFSTEEHMLGGSSLNK